MAVNRRDAQKIERTIDDVVEPSPTDAARPTS
jgi:hypothetical protein